MITAAVYYIVVNAAGAALFAADKRKARLGKWRIQEKTLLLWAFAGAAPLMILTGRLIRHKTRTLVFRAGMPAAVLIHAGFWIWMLM
ncbi:DUF1294 domain-containing protein [Alkalicoccus luteus]|uniref:DUF1294 domain-containing protein n=1 Tax=Alkalicoccus luteus TaxID=1237094 RepID=A0A969PWQ4_9BACI|nr:DUF1294 domain-containing protein [Alkalicoccus luteus]NJP37037.1 DUF1294 domain-containing protein [Alkalicoccus luteus]